MSVGNGSSKLRVPEMYMSLPRAVILFVITPEEMNVLDQRYIEFDLWQR